jgi:hypothetical protein
VFNATQELSFWAQALQTVGFSGMRSSLRTVIVALQCNRSHGKHIMLDCDGVSSHGGSEEADCLLSQETSCFLVQHSSMVSYCYVAAWGNYPLV